MILEWDIEKEKSNIRKHKLDFSLSERMVADPLAIVAFDRHDGGEDRYHLIAMVGHVCLVLVHAYPDPEDDGVIRVIGLREATPRERRRYEEDSHDGG